MRDRLSILAESDAAPWLDPARASRCSTSARRSRERAVVYFRLDSDRRPLLAAMLAAAIVCRPDRRSSRDLQANPIPTVVLIDEFSAVAAEQVARLFGRAPLGRHQPDPRHPGARRPQERRRRSAARADARQRRDRDRAPPERTRVRRADRADGRHAARPGSRPSRQSAHCSARSTAVAAHAGAAMSSASTRRASSNCARGRRSCSRRAREIPRRSPCTTRNGAHTQPRRRARSRAPAFATRLARQIPNPLDKEKAMSAPTSTTSRSSAS